MPWRDGAVETAIATTAGAKVAKTALAGIVAAAATIEAPLMDTLAADIGLRPSVLAGALMGAIVFALVATGAPRERLRRASAGFLVSWMISGGLIWLVGRVVALPVDAERALAGLVSAGGVYAAEAWVAYARRSAPSVIASVADRLLKRGEGGGDAK